MKKQRRKERRVKEGKKSGRKERRVEEGKKKGTKSEQEWLWIKTVKTVKRENIERRRENGVKQRDGV